MKRKMLGRFLLYVRSNIHEEIRNEKVKIIRSVEIK